MHKAAFLVSALWFLATLNVGAENMETINLPRPKLKGDISVEEAIARRRSVRNYSSKKLTAGQIGQLLWACQGITSRRNLRAAPSAGALYPLEIYLLTDEGFFRYIPDGHKLEKRSDENLKGALSRASWGQGFIEEAAVDIVICAVYGRVASRYGNRGIRYTDIEVGHAAENVHLEAVAMGLSSVPVGAFEDSAVSKILKLPAGEKPIYIIPVGYEER